MQVTITSIMRVVGEFQPYEFGVTLSDELDGLSARDIIDKDKRVVDMCVAAQELMFAQVDMLRETSPDFDVIFQARQEIIKNTKRKLQIE